MTNSVSFRGCIFVDMALVRSTLSISMVAVLFASIALIVHNPLSMGTQDAFAASDATKPSIKIKAPTSKQYLSPGTVKITGSASDNSGGSGLKLVEVRVDKSSYKAVKPSSSGDWSYWSVAFPITDTGKHTITARATDKAGNQQWHDITIRTGKSDPFGVRMMYPSKSGGEQWFMNMADPTSDKRFNPQYSISKNSDGSWKIKDTSVRMEVFTTSGYDPNKIKTMDQPSLASKGYMQDSRDWRNVEMTGYIKVNSILNDDDLSWYARGGKHSTSATCEATAYKSSIYYNGENRWQKQLAFLPGSDGYVFGTVSQNSIGDIEDRWVGFKAVIYNTKVDGKQAVRLELYADTNNDKTTWTKISTRYDVGSWSAESDYCGGSSSQIVTWGGPIATFRWDNSNNADFKWLSIREIQPPN